jgi:hypothetical protein
MLGVIRELEDKVIQQQTQKLQELGSAVGIPRTVSSMNDNPSVGPKEEITLDFESLVLGKKPAPPSFPNPSPQPPPFTQQIPQSAIGFPNSRSSTPKDFMIPMQPTAIPPTQPTTFYPPLQPTSYPSTNGFNSASISPSSHLSQKLSLPGLGNTSPPGLANTPFNANPWSDSGSSNSLTLTLPTIAPPPSASKQVTLQPQKSKEGSGLDKYQSLL